MNPAIRARLAERLGPPLVGAAVRVGVLARPGPLAPIRTIEGDRGEVDRYWTAHTVNSTPFLTPKQSLRYLEGRFAEYPLFREFSGLYGAHVGEVVVDYGCGPGNDL